MSLAAVSNYFRGRPHADRIEIPIIPAVRAMLTELRRGRVDMLPLPLTPEQVAGVKSISVRTLSGPLYLGTMVMFNVRRAPFDRVAVRRALAAVLDRQRIARAASASAPATTGFLHPLSRWAPPPAPLTLPPPGRPLAALGLREIRVLAPANDLVRREAGRQVVLALRRAGARARLVALSRRRLGRAVGEGGGPASFDLAIWGIPPLASHDPDFLSAVFGRPRAAGVINRTGYSSAAFDRIGRRVRAAPSVAARREAVSALLAQLAHDAPAIPLLFSEGTFAYRSPSPVGWIFAPGSGILDKQSLLRAAPARAARGGSPPAPAGRAAGDGPNWLGLLGGGILAAALLAGAAAALVRRS